MAGNGEWLEVAEAAARAAGDHALRNRGRRAETVSRSDHDVKLQLDLECQAKAEAVILAACPAAAIVGEEGLTSRPDAPVEWIIDPIDGTVNFTHGVPLWCCSIAARVAGRTVAGVVYAPALGECFTAVEDGPARADGVELSVSGTPRLSESMIATGALNRVQDSSRASRLLDALAPRVQKVRIFGSAALDLCYVAAGRIDGYGELSIYPWDFAAGRLLVERAGGCFELLRDWGGGRTAVLAGNPHVYAALRSVVAPIVQDGAKPSASQDGGAEDRQGG